MLSNVLFTSDNKLLKPSLYKQKEKKNLFIFCSSTKGNTKGETEVMMVLKERTSTWVIVVLVSMIILPTLGYETITWNLGTAEEPYTNMLTSLRSKLQSSTVCEFPDTSKSPAKANQFILMKIVYTQDKTVTVAFQTSNTYFLGYLDVYNGVPRANFVSDEYEKLKGSDLFSDAVGNNNRKKLPFNSSYASMESAAGLGQQAGRGNLAVGVENLGFLMKKMCMEKLTMEIRR